VTRAVVREKKGNRGSCRGIEGRLQFGREEASEEGRPRRNQGNVEKENWEKSLYQKKKKGNHEQLCQKSEKKKKKVTVQGRGVRGFATGVRGKEKEQQPTLMRRKKKIDKQVNRAKQGGETTKERAILTVSGSHLFGRAGGGKSFFFGKRVRGKKRSQGLRARGGGG